MKVSLYKAGYCTHPEYMITGKFSLKIKEFPMICGLIQHPRFGYILFDVGYNQCFSECTRSFPYSLYKAITPVYIPKTLKELLSENNIQANKINYIIISHFHADHICAINDFPDATIICSRQGHEYSNDRTFKLHKGILPELVEQFSNRKILFFEDMVQLYTAAGEYLGDGYDIFGDQSIVAYSLPGHAVGHYGVLCNDSRNGKIFFIGDAVWTIDTLEGSHKPHYITYALFDSRKNYHLTIQKLQAFHAAHPDITIVPSHCSKTYQRWLGVK